jgi:hypothetical protein
MEILIMPNIRALKPELVGWPTISILRPKFWKLINSYFDADIIIQTTGFYSKTIRIFTPDWREFKVYRWPYE